MPPPIPLPGPDASLDSILAAAWSLLVDGAARAEAPFHWPVLAGVDAREPGAPRPDARVVVLRAADPGARELEFHSDVRAHKLAQLRAAPGCLVFHDGPLGLQLRAGGPMRVHAGDALARRAWDALGASSRRAYLAPRVPGTASDRPDPNLPEGLRGALPDADEAEPGFANFAALRLRVRTLEWLRLGRDGHQRMRADWPDEGDVPSTTWIRP